MRIKINSDKSSNYYWNKLKQEKMKTKKLQKGKINKYF